MVYLLLILVVGNLIMMTFKSYRTVLGIVSPAIVISLSLIIVFATLLSKIAILIAICINLLLILFSVFVIIRVLQIEAEGPVDDFMENWQVDDNESIPVRNRVMTTKVTKMVVWQRDNGRCVACDSKQNLEFNYITPLSKGGSSRDTNIWLLCQTCYCSKMK